MSYKYHTVFLLTLLFCNNALSRIVQKKTIYVDIAHGQRFWNDPSDMRRYDQNLVDMVKYMTDQFRKTAASVNAELFYLKKEIKPDLLQRNL